MNTVKAWCWSFAIAAPYLCATHMHAQTQPSLSESNRAAAFDRLDRTSRMLIATVGCARRTAEARTNGLFGPPDSLGRRGQCLRKDGRAYGVFFTPDSTYTKALNLRVLDLANSVRYLGPVDTTAMLAETRVTGEALLKGFPAFQREARQFVPLSMRTDGDSIEVWFLPVGILMGRSPSTVGGERAFIYSPDGRTLAREIDGSNRYRSLAIPDSGNVVILSQEEDLPLVSELIVTNLLHDRGRVVQLVTKTFGAQLIETGSTSTWVQMRRR